MGKEVKRTLLFCAVIAWMVVIFLFSMQNADDSSSMSKGLLQWFLNTFYPHWEELSAARQQEVIDMIHTLFRKCGHFSEYAVLGILWTLNTRFEHWQKNHCRAWRIWLPFLLSLLYAISDEIHQLFVEGRSGEVRDVCIDFCGTTTGILILYGIVAIFRHLRKSKTDS